MTIGRAGFRVASQRLCFTRKPARLIIAGIGVAGQKILRLSTAQPKNFADLLLRQTVLSVAFHGDRFERKTLRVSVCGI